MSENSNPLPKKKKGARWQQLRQHVGEKKKVRYYQEESDVGRDEAPIETEKKGLKKKYLLLPFRYRVFSGLNVKEFLSLIVYLQNFMAYHRLEYPSAFDPLYFVLNMLDRISAVLVCSSSLSRDLPGDLVGPLSVFSPNIIFKLSPPDQVISAETKATVELEVPLPNLAGNISLDTKSGVPFYFDYPIIKVIREIVKHGSIEFKKVTSIFFYKEEKGFNELKEQEKKQEALFAFSTFMSRSVNCYPIGKGVGLEFDQVCLRRDNLFNSSPHLKEKTYKFGETDYQYYSMGVTNLSLFQLATSFITDGYLSFLSTQKVEFNKLDSITLLYRRELKFGTCETSTFSTVTSLFFPPQLFYNSVFNKSMLYNYEALLKNDYDTMSKSEKSEKVNTHSDRDFSIFDNFFDLYEDFSMVYYYAFTLLRVVYYLSFDCLYLSTGSPVSDLGYMEQGLVKSYLYDSSLSKVVRSPINYLMQEGFNGWLKGYYNGFMEFMELNSINTSSSLVVENLIYECSDTIENPLVSLKGLAGCSGLFDFSLDENGDLYVTSHYTNFDFSTYPCLEALSVNNYVRRDKAEIIENKPLIFKIAEISEVKDFKKVFAESKAFSDYLAEQKKSIQSTRQSEQVSVLDPASEQVLSQTPAVKNPLSVFQQMEYDVTLILQKQVESLGVAGDYWDLLAIGPKSSSGLTLFMVRWTEHKQNKTALFNDPTKIAEILKDIGFTTPGYFLVNHYIFQQERSQEGQQLLYYSIYLRLAKRKRLNTLKKKLEFYFYGVEVRHAPYEQLSKAYCLKLQNREGGPWHFP